MTILITGAAGFIGSHVSRALLDRGDSVIGFDNLNNYYDVKLKHDRLKILEHENFIFKEGDISDNQDISSIFHDHKIDRVVNLAAQAGVRYSLENPQAYVSSNLIGFVNILELCRFHNINHLVYASSSSVYGMNTVLPFSVSHNVDHPVSLYAATKKSNELLAHTYSHLFDLPTSGLRFFTVYGPWGRPDMALFIFVNQILNKLPVNLFNYGKMVRDFTYIDDIVEGILRVMKKIPNRKNLNKKKNKKFVPHQILNIGNNNPQKVINFIKAIEKNLKIKANIKFTKIQLGDVPKTHSSTKKIKSWIGFKPKTTINFGIKKFIEWYVQYYKIKNIK